MTISDAVMIMAVLLGPILAVQVARRLDDRKVRRDRRLAVFKTLMATRAQKLSAPHVEALNLIDVEFYEDRPVTLAWKEYLDHLNTPSSGSAQAWHTRTDDLFIELLGRMASALSYDFDKVHLKNQTYLPSAHSDLERDQHELRKRLINVLRGDLAVPFQVVTQLPAPPDIPEPQAATTPNAAALPAPPATPPVNHSHGGGGGAGGRGGSTRQY